MAMSQSINSHEWYGLVSTYKNEIIPNKLNLTGGIDVRYYVGHHRNELIDLYSGEYYMDDTDRKNVKAANNYLAADPNRKYEKLRCREMWYTATMTVSHIRKVCTVRRIQDFLKELSLHSSQVLSM